MRIFFLAIFSVSLFSLKAQTMLPYNPAGFAQARVFNPSHLHSDSNSLQKKWSVSKYGGISSSFLFANGMNATVFSAPIGVQLNRRLNNNLYAFAGVAAAPTYFNVNQQFNAGTNKNYMTAPRFNSNGFGISSRIEAGLMYVNDDRTFSISGSIGIERNNYPFYPAISTQKQPLTHVMH